MPDLNASQQRLNAARARKRRLALGPVLNQSEADLDARSQTGPERLAEIEAFVRDAAGQTGVDMLRATRG
jgi:hypothetical protein